MLVDCVARRRECSRCAIPYFDKCQAVVIKHDEVDLAATAVEIPRDGEETLADEIVKCQLLCQSAYSSCVAEFHGASSAASGAIKDPSSLMS